ncbi:MAG: tetratricopeptide repeat protein [Chloroflexi bacterium]|nr:tetratricopeptide repeat protein [Chloroflexota bacterium]
MRRSLALTVLGTLLVTACSTSAPTPVVGSGKPGSPIIVETPSAESRATVTSLAAAAAGQALKEGTAAFEAGRDDEAIERLSAAIAVDGGLTDAYAWRGRAYSSRSREGDAEKAVADANRAIDLDPEHFLGYYVRGSVYSRVRQETRAIADFDMAIKLAPNFAPSYSNRGSIYYELGRRTYDPELLRKAEPDFTKTIDLAPNTFKQAYNNRGRLRWLLGALTGEAVQLDGALADFDKAIEIDPRYAVAYGNRAVVFRDQGQLEKAQSDANKALDIDGATAEHLARRCTIHNAARRYDAALVDCDDAVVKDPKFSQAYADRAAVHLGLNRVEDALLDYSKAIDLESTNAYYFLERGLAFKRAGRLNEAWYDLERAARLFPKSPVLLRRAQAGFEGLPTPPRPSPQAGPSPTATVRR